MKHLVIQMTDKIEEYILDGYKIKYESKEKVILEKPKKFNWLAFIGLSILLSLFGTIIYLIYYSTKKSESVIVNKGENNGRKKRNSN